jgi:hypothetical protein
MKTLFVSCLLCLCGIVAVAQSNNTAFRRSTYIKVNPTTLINELDIAIEQEFSEKLSLEIGIGGIYTDYPDYVLAKKIDFGQKRPDISTEQFVDGRGLAFRAGLRWYLFSQKDGLYRAQGTYFQPVLLYKKIFYPNEEVTINNTTYKESADKDVFGLQFLLGRQIRKDKFIIDPYIGLGVRTKVYSYRNFSQNSSGVAQANDGQLISVLPSLHLGIKIGLKM